MEFKKLEIINGVGKGENEYFVYDEDGEYICNCLNIEIAEEIARRVNDYEELVDVLSRQSKKFLELQAQIRELVKAINICNEALGSCIDKSNSNYYYLNAVIERNRKALEKLEGIGYVLGKGDK